MRRPGKQWSRVLSGLRGEDAEAKEASEAEGRLWHAYEAIREASTNLMAATAQLLNLSSRKQSIVDELRETARVTQARSAQVLELAAQLTEVLERLRLVALNVGLEGARLGDQGGRALSTVADEVRGHVERGSGAAGELRAMLDEETASWNQLISQADELRRAERESVAQLGFAQGHGQTIAQGIESVGSWARKLSETDPETARTMAQASEHARALMSSLSALGDRARRELVRTALEPTLQPLARVLAELSRSPAPPKKKE